MNGDRSDGSMMPSSRATLLDSREAREVVLGTFPFRFCHVFSFSLILSANSWLNADSMTLARFEMAFILATIFLRYDVYRGQTGPTLELYDTYRDRDIDANCDYIIPMADPGSKGLQVRVRN